MEFLLDPKPLQLLKQINFEIVMLMETQWVINFYRVGSWVIGA